MQKKYYAVLREVFPALSAQAAIHVVRKVADAYQKDKKTALADHNAARVIASRAYVSTPIAAMPEMALAASPQLWPWGC